MMNHLLRSLALAAVALVVTGCALTTQDRPSAAKHDKIFPLGVWYEGGVGDAHDNVLPKDPKLAAPIYDRNFSDIAAHSINVVVPPNSPPDHHQVLIDAADAHHLLVLPELALSGAPIHTPLSADRNVTAFGFYPYSVDKKPNDIPTLRDFESASTKAVADGRKTGADCWAVIQCHAVNGKLRYPLPAEIRAMTWLALGTGVKGIFWFQYQTEHVSPSQGMDGLVDHDFNARPDWDEVGRLAKELAPLTPSLLDLKPASDEKATVIRRKSMYPMTDSKGRKYLLAVNVDPSVPQTLHLSLKTPATKVLRLPDGKEIPSVRKGDMLTWHEEFPPGSGALYRVE